MAKIRKPPIPVGRMANASRLGARPSTLDERGRDFFVNFGPNHVQRRLAGLSTAQGTQKKKPVHLENTYRSKKLPKIKIRPTPFGTENNLHYRRPSISLSQSDGFGKPFRKWLMKAWLGSHCSSTACVLKAASQSPLAELGLCTETRDYGRLQDQSHKQKRWVRYTRGQASQKLARPKAL